MKKLEDFTLKQVCDYHIDKIANKRGISKSFARKLFINAISYNIVFNEIDEQIDYLLECDEDE